MGLATLATSQEDGESSGHGVSQFGRENTGTLRGWGRATRTLTALVDLSMLPGGGGVVWGIIKK